MKILIVLIVFYSWVAMAQNFECRNLKNEVTLKGFYNEQKYRIEKLELIHPKLVIFAIQQSVKEPTSTSSYLYSFPLSYDRRFKLNVEPWVEALHYLGAVEVLRYSSYGEDENDPLNFSKIVLKNIWTQFMIPVVEIKKNKFRAHISFRDHFDGWASDKTLLASGLNCTI